MSYLQISSLTKRYTRRGPLVVNDLSLEIEKGEIICVLGESGSGKTTLLRMIAGFEMPDAGEVMIAGETLNASTVFRQPEARGISMVFQGNSLFPHLTVRRNILYGLHRVGPEDSEQRLKEMLELTGLEQFVNSYPHELSGGQQQRVAVARALAPSPTLLLLDEPFSNLDNICSRQIRDDIVRIIRRSQTTAVIVTHDTNDALVVGDRIAILNHGVLLQVGTPRDVYEHPRTRFVAELFGASNILDVKRLDGNIASGIGCLPLDLERIGTDAVSVSIRPEHLQVVDDGADAIHGQVVDNRYHGSFQELLVSVNGDTGPAIEFRLHYFGTDNFATNDDIYFKVPPDKIQVLE
jgi:iron(III) transport system ATP-binding protein